MCGKLLSCVSSLNSKGYKRRASMSGTDSPSLACFRMAYQNKIRISNLFIYQVYNTICCNWFKQLYFKEIFLKNNKHASHVLFTILWYLNNRWFHDEYNLPTAIRLRFINLILWMKTVGNQFSNGNFSKLLNFKFIMAKLDYNAWLKIVFSFAPTNFY